MLLQNPTKLDLKKLLTEYMFGKVRFSKEKRQSALFIAFPFASKVIAENSGGELNLRSLSSIVLLML